MTPERLAVLARVADALPDLDRPLLVAVDGGDGAGKTWFADELATVLAERDRAVVRASVDDFHHPRSHRHALGRTGETVWARSFDYRALRRELLDPWCAGAGAPYRCRHHDLATDALLDEPPETRCRSTACSSSTASSPNARSCAAAGTWWCGWRWPTRSEYAGWPAATVCPPTSRTPTSAATSTPSGSTATPPTPSAPPTSSSTTPTRRPRLASSVAAPPGWHRVGGRRADGRHRSATAETINRLLASDD